MVDWLITTSSWVDSVDDHRCRWERIRYTTEGAIETLMLTSKPYPLLESRQADQPDSSDEPSLEALLKFCEALRRKFYSKDSGKEGIRSQLKHFLGELRKGRTYAELAWAELPESVHKHFEDHPPTGFRSPDSNETALWLDLGNAVYRCWVADAIELVELQQIGRHQKEEDPTKDAPGADEGKAA